MKSFLELGIAPPILKALEEMGFTEPTPVQEQAIPHILNHEDLIVMSKTGSGKTAVFGVSILQLIDADKPGPQGLILTPTRELAVQVDSDLAKISAHLDHKTTAVYGQHSMNVEIQTLKKGASIVTGTPGRVFDHIQHGNLNTRHISFLVLDEADRMLDMGFIGQVVKIIRTLPKNRITLLFSATIPPEVKRICTDYMRNPVTIEIESATKTVDTIQQAYYRVNHNEKRTQLNRLLITEQPESCIIFCNTRIAVDQVQNFLTKKGYASHALHGDIAQGTRLKTMQQFKEGNFHILVATDVAARGIHIDDLSLVINYDIPIERDSYIHRIGRTGRAGNGGRAISLVTGDDLMTLYEIEEHIGALIEEASLPSEDVFNQRMSEAGPWLEANSLKNKPAQSQTPVREGSGENRQRRSSGQQRRTENRPSVQSSAQRTDRQNHPASKEQQGKVEGRKATDRRSSDNRPAAQEKTQRGETGRNVAAGQAGETRRQPSRQANGSPSERNRSYTQSPGTAQAQTNRNARQSGDSQPAYSRKQTGEPSNGQQDYPRRQNNQYAANARPGGEGYNSRRQADTAGKGSSPQSSARIGSGSGQSSYRKPVNGTSPVRGQAELRREDQKPGSVTKKEPLIKRIFYRLFGK